MESLWRQFRRWLAIHIMPENAPDSGLDRSSSATPPPPYQAENSIAHASADDADASNSTQWEARIREYCAPRFTELAIQKNRGRAVYLHCSGCGEDHASGYFSATQRALPSTSRICIGREGFIRLCEHKTMKWEEVERAFQTDRVERRKEGLRIMCEHSDCWQFDDACGDVREFACLEINPNYDQALTYKWSSHYSTQDLEREQGPSNDERLRAAMARRHGGDPGSKKRVLCPVSRFGEVLENRDIRLRNRNQEPCRCDEYGNQSPCPTARGRYCLGLICSFKYTYGAPQGNKVCADAAGHVFIDWQDKIPWGSGRKLNPGKGWFSMIHPDSYNAPDGETTWCNEPGCMSYLLAGEPHVGAVGEWGWNIRQPCRQRCI